LTFRDQTHLSRSSQSQHVSHGVRSTSRYCKLFAFGVVCTRHANLGINLLCSSTSASKCFTDLCPFTPLACNSQHNLLN